MFRYLQYPDISIGISVVLLCVIQIYAAFYLGKYAAGRFGGNKARAGIVFAVITLVMTVLLLCRYGISESAIKGIILCLILVFVSFQDINTRECDEYIHIMVLITGFIGTKLADIPGNIISAVSMLGIMLLSVHFTKSDIGGADIKISAAVAFVLGLQKGLVGLVLGLSIAVIVNLIKAENKKAGFPAVPYLAAGFMAAYFI